LIVDKRKSQRRLLSVDPKQTDWKHRERFSRTAIAEGDFENVAGRRACRHEQLHRLKRWEIVMLRLRPAALAALILVGSPYLANAQNAPDRASPERLNASELKELTDGRISIVKFALQMTPDQALAAC
jgi:hypothetical protein